MTGGDLVIRNAGLRNGGVADISIEHSVVSAIGRAPRARVETIDAHGRLVVPGLADHHVHILATAAARQSLDLGPHLGSTDSLGEMLRQAACASAPGRWIRGVNYHESLAGPLDRARLDALCPDAPVRVQYRQGSLWVLNTAALAALGDGVAPQDGRLWRGDSRLKCLPPLSLDLTSLGYDWLRLGVTSLTDASATTGVSEAALLAGAVRSGALPQRLTLMSGGALAADPDYRIGPVKIVLDDAELGDFHAAVERVAQARAWKRAVAFHCVTAAELGFALAVLHAAGACRGDRIEHGGMIAPDAAESIAALGLTVVTQPGLLCERGDAFLAEGETGDDLFPCASLMRRGIAVAGSTDTPYAARDIWRAMRHACTRTSPSGVVIGADERVDENTALDLFLGAPEAPARPRDVRVGDRADLAVLARPLHEAIAGDDDPIAATILGGRVVFSVGG